MTIINTTFVIERSIEGEFVNWLKEVYVPAAMATGMFVSSRVAQVLSNEDPQAVSLACELVCDSLSEGVRWHDNTAVLLRDDMTARWGSHALFFTTYLRTID